MIQRRFWAMILACVLVFTSQDVYAADGIKSVISESIISEEDDLIGSEYSDSFEVEDDEGEECVLDEDNETEKREDLGGEELISEDLEGVDSEDPKPIELEGNVNEIDHHEFRQYSINDDERLVINDDKGIVRSYYSEAIGINGTISGNSAVDMDYTVDTRIKDFYPNVENEILKKIRNAPAKYYVGGETVNLTEYDENGVKNTVTGVLGTGTCFAYSIAMYHYLFGSVYSTIHHGPKGGLDLKDKHTKCVGFIRDLNSNVREVQELLGKALPGDVLMATSKTSQHFMIFMYAKDTNNDGLVDKIYTAEGNYDNYGHIKIEYEHSLSYFTVERGNTLSLYHRDDYDNYCHRHNYKCNNKETTAHCDVAACPEPKWLEKDHLVRSFNPGKYIITSSLSLYAGPYSGSSKTGKTISKNDTVFISKAMENAFGNIWGYVDDKSGFIKKKGWICIRGENDSSYKFKRKDGGAVTHYSVTFDPMNIPSNGHTGSYNLKTVISCDGGIIEKVTGVILDQDKREVQKSTAAGNNSSTFEVYNSGINKGKGCLSFGKLSAGKYTYKYYVKIKDVEIPFEKTSSSFTIGNVITYKEPSITQVGASIGEVVYKIDNSGYRIKYSTNDGNTYTEFTNSKEIKLNASTTIQAYTVGTSSNKYASNSGVVANASAPVYVRSAEVVKSVTIEKVKTPTINYSQNGDGTTVSISVSGSYKTIYFKIGNGSYKKYNGPFTVTTGTTVYSYAENIGMITSDIGNKYIPVARPNTPSVTRTSNMDIAEGDAVTIHWNNDSKAKTYHITVNKDNVEWKSFSSKTAYCVFNTEGSGIYTISVVAKNAIGESSPSNEVSCVAHDPVTVRFLDWDDSTIGTVQTVRYGHSATRPLAPRRRGYTFSGWDGNYQNVTADTDIKAEYEICTYTVKFYDVSGKNYLGEQSVVFDNSIDKELFSKKVLAENAGRHFTGWEIFNVRDDESYLDIEHVDSDMLVRAVTTWSDETFPCLISNVSATPIVISSEEDKGIGFRVTCNVSSTDSKNLKAKIMVSLCSSRDDSSYRMIKTSTKEMIISAGTSNKIEPIDVTYDGSVKIDKIMVSVVSVESNDRTGGLIAKPQYYDVLEGSYLYYSGWVTAEEARAKGYSIDGKDVLTRTVYRSRSNNRNVTGWTRDAVAPSGYKLLESAKRLGTWSSWKDSAVNASSLRDVETQKVTVKQGYTAYRYGCWTNGAHTVFCPKYGKTKWGGSWSTKYTGWSKSRTSSELVGTVGTGNFCPYKVYGCNRSSDHIGVSSSHNNSSGQPCDYWQYKYHPTSNGDDYYWEESKYVDTSYTKTQYRYRDNYYEYNYYTFETGWWGPWSTSAISEVHNSTQDIDVQSRIEYNILLGSVPPADNSGKLVVLDGSLNDSALTGKSALILIYKESNTDPTESQIEYVGETTLSQNGEYHFSVITKDTPNYLTGDFVVALAIEGSDNYLNIDQIRYKRNEYSVKFISDGNVISEDKVEEGHNAVAPEIVEKKGYDFVGWDRNVTAVHENLSVVAIYKPKKYCVAFVDYENRTCNLTMQDYDSLLTLPDDMEIPMHEGYEFDGWDFEEGTIVKDNVVVHAKWIPKTFSVKFMDAYGNTINTQNIEYGCSAEIPQLNVADAMEFIGWDQSKSWWHVTKDMEVHPIVIYKNKLVAPTSDLDFNSVGEGKYLKLEAQNNADIYYTLDGTTPSVENYLLSQDERKDVAIDSVSELVDDSDEYDEDSKSVEPVTYKYYEPILLDEDCEICAIAVAPEFEDSEIARFSHSMISTDVEKSEKKEISKQYVYLKSGEKVKFTVDLKDVTSLSEIDLLIDAHSAEICPVYDDKDNVKMTVSEKFLEQGDVSVNMIDEDGYIDFRWVGSETITNPGRMFTAEMIVDEQTPSGYYPISLLYAPRFTSDCDDERLPLEGKVQLLINEDDEKSPGDSEVTIKKYNLVVNQKYQLSNNDFGVSEKIDKYLVLPRSNASISSKGLIKAKRAGKVSVTAYTKDSNGRYVVIGKSVQISIEKPSLKYMTLKRAGQIVSANEILRNTTIVPTSWSSSKPSVVKVNKTTGEITAIKSGTAKITARFGEGKYSAAYSTKITVYTPKLSASKMKLTAGKTKRLKIKHTSLSVSEWKSSDDSIAKVSPDGLVIAVSGGTAKISATVDGVDYVCNVEVKKLSPKKLLVWFDANGGSINTINKVVKKGKKYGKLPIPVRQGHMFMGWYTKQVGGNIVTSNTVAGYEDCTVYAVWDLIPADNTYKVFFDANGGSVEVAEKEVKKGDQYGVLPVPIREGYHFVGWYTDRIDGVEVKNTDIVNLISNKTLYAHWDKEANGTVIVLDPRGGGKDSGITIDGVSEKNITLSIAEQTKSLLENKGYVVLMTRDGDETVYTSERIEKVVDSNPAAVISIGLNSGTADNADGYYSVDGTGEMLAQLILESVCSGMLIANNGTKAREGSGAGTDYYAIIREARENGITAVLINEGSLNSATKERYESSEWIALLAKANAIGIDDYFKALE